MTTTASLTQALRDFACARDWAQFQKAWQSPRVSAFIDRLAEDPNIVSRLHQWEEVGAA